MMVCSMDAEKLLEAISLQIKLARILLQIATPDTDDPSDVRVEARVVEHAGQALQLVRTLLRDAQVADGERAYIESELSQLEKDSNAHPLAKGKGRTSNR